MDEQDIVEEAHGGRPMNLPLPKPFDGTPESWPKWRTRFDRYRTCTGLTRKPEREQVCTLLYSMGESADDLLVTMNVDEQTISYTNLLQKFDTHFNVRKNVITARAKFNRRVQMGGEPIDAFLQDLHRLADECDYGNLKEELIRDRIVVGVTDDALSEKLQMIGDLTLTDAILYSRQAEARRESQAVIRGKSEGVDAVHTRRPQSKNHVSRRQLPQTTHHSKNHKNNCSNCSKCGREHASRPCPARNEICHNCRKKGHYSRMCLLKRKGEKNTVHAVEDGDNNEDDEHYLGCLDLNSIDSDCWAATVAVNGKLTTFKLDTGAAVTAVGREVVGNAKVRPTHKTLCGPGNASITVLGCVDVTLSYKEKQIQETLYVIEKQKVPLLSRRACERLGLVKRVESLNATTLNQEFPGLFHGLGKTKKSCTISLRDDARPVCLYTARKVPHPLLGKVKAELSKMEANGVISPVTEPTDWCSALVVVPKPNGSVRLCIDLTNLNKAVRREVFPMASVDESLAQLAESRVFSKLDAKSGFWQIPLAEESRPLTTFVTPYGRFCMNRLPFGISSAPEIFQRMMKEILQDMEGIVCHMDDVLVHAPNEEKHNEILKEALRRLKEAGITLNEKCEFSRDSVKFLGHIIDASGIHPDPAKVEAITAFPTPDVTELQRFFGMVNHVAKFMPGIAHKTEPLRQLLRKGQVWCWDRPQEKAFEELKALLSSDTVLAHYSTDRKTTVAADASNVGIGAVLLQEQPDGSRRPVSFISRSLSAAEKNYAVIEKEALAATWAIERFSDYLLGMDFTLETDHKPLVPLLSSKEIVSMPPRIQRFRLRLMRFNPSVIHVPGKNQVTADALSRAPVGKPETADVNLVDEAAAMVWNTIKVLPASPQKLQEIREAQKADEVVQQVRDYCRHGWPAYTPANPLLKPFWESRHHLTIAEDLLLYDERLVIPASMRLEVLSRLHKGHLGVTKCRALASSSVWWPSLSAAIEEMVSRCATCAKHRPERREPLLPSSFPSRPWERLGMDLFEHRGQQYLLIVDYYSRWVEVKHLTSQTSTAVIRQIKSVFSIHGIPDVVVSDNGPQFASAEFMRFARDYEFVHVTSSPRYPQSNGEAERAVQTVKKIWKKADDPYLALLLYRAAPLQNGFSPSQLLMGRRLKTTIPAKPSTLQPKTPDHALVQRKEEVNKKRQCDNYDRRHAAKPAVILHPGDAVHIRDLDRPGQVLARHTSPRSFVVQTDQGIPIRRNNRHLVKTSGEPAIQYQQPSTSGELCPPAPAEATPFPLTTAPRRSGRVIKKPKRLDL